MGREILSDCKKAKRIKRNWQMYAMLAIPVAYMLVFHYYPMLGVQIAFKKYSGSLGIWESPWVGFENFQKFIQSYQFLPVLRNTLLLSLYSIVVMIPIPLMLALSFNALRGRLLKKMVQLITYMPNFISTVVAVGILKQIFHPKIGIFSQLFFALGLEFQDPFGSASLFPHLYVWSGVWQKAGWSSIIYIAALSAINPEIHEAAQMDGASRLQRILRIELPILLPTAVIMLILNMGQVMSIGFEKIYLMQTDLNLSWSEVIPTYVYKMGLMGRPDYGYSVAIDLFNSVINMLFIVGANTLFIKIS